MNDHKWVMAIVGAVFFAGCVTDGHETKTVEGFGGVIAESYADSKRGAGSGSR